MHIGWKATGWLKRYLSGNHHWLHKRRENQNTDGRIMYKQIKNFRTCTLGREEMKGNS